MAVINVTELIADIKESVNLRPEQSSTYIQRMLRYTVLDVSKRFSSLFHATETYDSDDNGVIELPADIFRVLSVIHGENEAVPQGIREYEVYKNRDISYTSELFACVKQHKDKVELKLLPAGKYEDVIVVAQQFNQGAGNMGEQYSEMLHDGTVWRYLKNVKRQDAPIVSAAKAVYKDHLDTLTFEQNQMYPQERSKFYYESQWEKNFNFTFLDQTRDVY
jgi:hypothetical protein